MAPYFKYLACIGFLLVLCSTVTAESINSADSLINELPNAKSGQDSISLLNEAVKLCYSTSPTKGLAYMEIAVSVGEGIKPSSDYATSLNLKGLCFWMLMESDSAIHYCLKSLDVKLEIGDEEGVASSYNNLAFFSRKLGDFSSAEQYYLQSLETYRRIGNSRGTATALKNLAVLYTDLGSYDKAVLFFNNSIEEAREDSNSDIEAYSQIGLGSIWLEERRYAQALQAFYDAKHIFSKAKDDRGKALADNSIGNVYYLKGVIDSALFYYNRSLSSKLLSSNKETLANTYSNLGIVYLDLGLFDSAHHFLLVSKSVRLSIGDSSGLAISYANLAKLFEYRLITDSAVFYYQKVLALSNYAGVLNQLDALRNLSELLHAEGKYAEAKVYTDQYFVLQDSFQLMLASAASTEARYKDQKLELEKANTINTKRKFKNSVLVLALVFTTLLFITITYALLKRNSLQKTKTEIDSLIKNAESRSLETMLKTSEEVRQQIARELHDRLGGTLSMVKFHFHSVQEQLEQAKVRNDEEYKKAQVLIDQAVKEVRDISHGLHAGKVADKGLKQALEELKVSVMDYTKLEINLIYHRVPETLDIETKIHIYRIVQELVSNALKHAKASVLNIQLIYDKEQVTLTVDDNGIGFPPSYLKESSGVGLRSIRERVEVLKGQVTVDSGRGSGTTFIIEIPYKPD